MCVMSIDKIEFTIIPGICTAIIFKVNNVDYVYLLEPVKKGCAL